MRVLYLFVCGSLTTVAICRFATAQTVTIPFSGEIDGSDTIDVTPTQAVWTTNYFGTPNSVNFAGQAWDPQLQSTLTPAAAPFIPSDLTDYRVNVVQTAGRDQVAAETSGNDLLIHVDDTPNGADQYNFQVVLTKEPPKIPTTQTLLHIHGTFDGSDRIVITNSGATLEHYFWGYPTNLTLNGVPWDPTTQPTLPNSGATTFLPSEIDLTSATFMKNEGRDLASFEVFNDHVDVVFADSPVGASDYDVTLFFSTPAPEPYSCVLFASALTPTILSLRYGRRSGNRT